jgi:hypothetical protein
MLMRKLILLSLSATAIVWGSPSHSTEWLYADLIHPPSQLRLSKSELSLGGRGAPLITCEANAEYHCFYGAGIEFAIPKKIDKQTSWKFNKVTYSVSKREKFPLLGIPLDAIFIRQKGAALKLSYIFDRDRGLIGIQYNEKITRLYVLEGHCGFAAAPTCNSLKDNAPKI